MTETTDWPLVRMDDPPPHCAAEKPCDGSLARPCVCGQQVKTAKPTEPEATT